MNMVVVVGNPKPKSRTMEAGILAAKGLAGGEPDLVIDLADLGAGLLEWGNKDVEEAVASVSGANAVIFASPTYKATYTGLLKLFLDQIPYDGLAGVIDTDAQRTENSHSRNDDAALRCVSTAHVLLDRSRHATGEVR